MFCRFYTLMNKPRRQHQAIFVINEIFSLLLLVICNILAISGIIKDKPYLLIPWLVVFPLGLGLIFHLFWTLARNTFNTMKEE